MFITNSELSGNQAVSGGAIYNDKGHVEIASGTTVENNTATEDGGAFYTIGMPQVSIESTLLLFDSFVLNNTAIGGSGGGVYADTDRVDFNNTTVSGNRAALDGGAVYASSLDQNNGNEFFRSQSLSTLSSSFTDNVAGQRGGALFAVGYQVVLDSTSFVGNQARSGGAIYADETDLGFSSLITSFTVFENNVAQGAIETDGEGGAIYTSNGNTNISDQTRFLNNRAIGGAGGGSGRGGAIYSNRGLFIAGATFDGNSASEGNSEGGALWLSSFFSESINASTFTNNSANVGGGLYLSTEAFVNYSTLAGNRALTGEGGAIYASGGLQSTNSTIHGNTAATNGGGIYIGFTETQSELRHVTITDNRADADGNASGLGGGVFTDNPIRVFNSIVASNLVGAGSQRSDISGPLNLSSSGNIVSVDVGVTGIANGSSFNQVGTIAAPINPLLGPLKNNGGRTSTRALLDGSPALDNANSSFALSVDQRNDFFFNGVFQTLRTGRADIGAYERVFDFGDAASVYPVLASAAGARHEMTSNLYLGNRIDSNANGLPTVDASGDDANFPDDEDGVAFRFMTATFMARADVTASAAGLLTGWIDLNRDGDWDDAGEQVLTDQPVLPGVNPVDFSVGNVDFAGANSITTYARFRLSTQAGLTPRGIAPDGEVEDYRVTISKVVLPADPSIPGGSFTFREEPVIVRVRRGYDPLLASGYDYAVQSGPKFATLELPPGYGDNNFTLSFVDANNNPVVIPFQAGKEIDFEFGTIEGVFAFDGISGGISSFRIDGIELSANVDATSSVAFLTILSFADSGSVTFTQTPISVLVAPNDNNATSENAVVSSAAPGVLANDTYPGATLTVTEVSGSAANVGTATTLASGASVQLNADGSYAYNPGTAFDYLPSSISAVDSFIYKVSDGPRTAIATVSITLTGVNDAATIAGDFSGSVTEDSASGGSASGTLVINDVDTGEAKLVAGVLEGTYGAFTFDAETGKWTYVLNNSATATNALSEGQLVQDTLTITSLDGTASRTIEVTIVGANDAASIAGVATGTVTEDNATTSASGQLTVSDVDSPLTFQTPASLSGTYGSFAFSAATGEWAYTLDNADPDTNALAEGAIVSDTLTVVSSDGTASTVISIAITGSNDAASIAGTASGAVTEDAAVVTAIGTLSVLDVDSPRVFQTPLGLAGTYGNFVFDSTTGEWTYTLDNADPDTNALAAGAVVSETLTVVSSDGTASKVIEVKITGENDAATITGASTGAVTEDSAVSTASGTLTVQDVDSPQEFQTPPTLIGTYGSFTFNSTTGEWSYALNNSDPDTNALAAGAIVQDQLTVTSRDGTASKVIEVTITGANDAATITGTATGAVTEDAAASTVFGTLTVQDVDSPQQFRTPSTLVGTYGSFTFSSTSGGWSYVLNNSDPDTNALAAGAVVQDRLTVESSDGTASRVIEVTITGANDAATISGLSTGTLTEDAAVTTVSGTLTVQDVDSPQNFRTPTSLVGTYGSFAFNPATGAWSYTLDNADPDTNALATGQVVRDSLTVVSNDGTASRLIDITINGNNDGVVNAAPTVTISGPTAGVRGQELTFTLSANDSAADRAAGFRYVIRWGDGTPDTIIARAPNNGTGVTVKHKFAATGTFNVSVVATDRSNAASSPAIRSVTITAAAVQTDPRNPNGKALVVGGTTGDDTIEVYRQNNQTRVKINGVISSYSTPLTNIIVYGQAGNDNITVATSVTTPAMLFGDDGNDCLKAGSGVTIMNGGAGNDFLYGGTARDILIGGLGRDVLFGNGDGDLLIGSTTSHDNDLGILGSIADEWSSSRSYQTRISNLRGRLNTSTVIDDRAADILWGSSGLDWYFAELRKSTRDIVYSNIGEVVDGLL